MEVDEASVKVNIEATSEDAVNGIKKVTKALKEAKAASDQKFNNPMYNLFGKNVDTARMTSELAKYDRAISSTEKQIKSLQKAQDAMQQALAKSKETGTPIPDMDSFTAKFNETKAKIDELSGSLEKLKQVRQQVSAAFQNPIEPQIGDIKEKAIEPVQESVDSQAAANMERTESAARRVVTALRSAGAAAKEASARFRELAGAAKSTEKPTSQLVSSLKRIAYYRIIRSIIKSIGDAFREGMKNAYAFAQGIETPGHRFATAMDLMASSTLKMKNQLGAAFLALLSAIAPIVNAIINLVTRAAIAITQLFSAFTGGTFLKAKDVSATFADNMKKGAGAAKEWKNQLLSFDEINRLEEPNQGGGGGGASTIDPSTMFEDVEVEGIFKKIADKWEALKKSLDFSSLIESWNRLKESAISIWGTISEAIGWVWDNILEPLAHWVIEDAGPASLDLLTAAFDLLNEVLKEVSPAFQWLWDNILVPLAEWTGATFIAAMNEITDLLKKMRDLISGDTSFSDFISTLDGWQVALLAVATAVVAVKTALGLAALATGAFGLAMGITISPVTLVIAALAGLIYIGTEVYRHWDSIAQWWDTNVVAKFRAGGEDLKRDWENVKESALKVIDGIKKGWNDLKTWWNNLKFPAFHIPRPHFEWTYTTATGWVADALKFVGLPATIPHLNISWYAKGGHPNTGELFFASEAGPEMVGTMNGQNTVATNADIVAGIRQGVFEAVSAAMNNSNGGEAVVKVYLDGREIRSSQQRVARAMGV